MAKLSDRQKNNIIAKWNTGEYTKTQLAKTYKVSEKTIRDIVGKKEPTNTHIVEAQILLEKIKNSEKTPSEIAAIDQAVKHRLEKEFHIDNKRVKIYSITDKILEKVSEMLESGTKQIVAKVKEFDGKASSESLDTVSVDLDPSDLKSMQETVDKASITNNTNARHAPKTEINNNQQNNNQKVIKVEYS